MKFVFMTHDLSSAFGQLARAALVFPRGKPSVFSMLPRDLAVAAVGFTIQLAIDLTDRDPADLRALEQKLIAALETSDEDAA